VAGGAVIWPGRALPLTIPGQPKNLVRQVKLPSKCWVHFDNEVHLGKMDKKVQLAKMHRPYVGIRKNHTTFYSFF
jgi:hypothetical protein